MNVKSEKSQEDEFNEGWEEGEESAKTQESEQTEQQKANEETTDGGQAGETIPDTQEATDGSGKTDELSEIERYKAELEKERQRMKSWEGRITKEAELRKQAEERLQALEEAAKSKDNADDEDDDDDLREAFRDEYGEELPDYVEKLIEQNARKKIEAEINELKSKEIQPLMDNLAQVQAQEQLRLAREAVLSVHPDMDDIIQSGELENWIGTLPETFKEAAINVYEQGNPQQVTDLLTQYKAASQTGGAPNQRKELREKGTVVDSRSSAPPKGSPNKNDYDAGWGLG